MEVKELEQIASQVRRDIVRMVAGVNSGHPGGSLGCADFLTVLYFDEMNHNPTDFKMDGKEEDVFYLSNGHISPVWYSVLARSGYFPVSELGSFRMISSRLQGHPSTLGGFGRGAHRALHPQLPPNHHLWSHLPQGLFSFGNHFFLHFMPTHHAIFFLSFLRIFLSVSLHSNVLSSLFLCSLPFPRRWRKR
jgi:hypothetical protein